ncbi:MAG TPA: hypothetical protein VL094_03710 [Sphingomonadaceae bacterium]|nr:hypothetical protein [Sphingomonadaceae bacterium]
MRWKAILGAAIVVAFQVPAAAEDTGLAAVEGERSYAAEVAEAERIGREMFLYDQAAWQATDRFLPRLGKLPQEQLRGYIVIPGEDGLLEAVFYGEVDGALREFARYDVREGKVVGGGILAAADRAELSPLAQRLVAARDAAIAEVIAKDYRFCSDQRPNTIVLPPDANDIVSAYLMTAPVSNASYPLGGHFRVDVGPDGKAGYSRRFLNSCFDAPFGSGEGNGKKKKKGKADAPVEPEALVVTHLLDPYPTEIHAFVSRYLPIGMIVVTTPNRGMWAVEGGRISFAGPLPEEERQED